MRRKIIGSRRGMALKPMIDEVVDRERADDPGRGHRPPADAGEREPSPAPRDERARQRRAERVAGFFGGDEIDRQRSRRRSPFIAARPRARRQRKSSARSAAAITLRRFGDDRAAGGNRNSGKAGARDILDRLRPDRRQIEAAVLARLRRLDQNADAGRRRHAPLAAQSAMRASILSVPSAASTAEHMAVGDDHRLTDIERRRARRSP